MPTDPMTPTTTPAARDGASDAELDALRARIQRLEAALRKLLYAKDTKDQLNKTRTDPTTKVWRALYQTYSEVESEAWTEVRDALAGEPHG